MTATSTKSQGLRERKKQETLQRIAETGLKLFVQNGYEGTTLDEIAAEAGIARRTFFYYFKSKEAILMAYMDGGRLCESAPSDPCSPSRPIKPPYPPSTTPCCN